VSAGLVGKVLIQAAHLDPFLKKNIYVDVGSSLDLFVGKVTRDYNHPKYRKEFCNLYTSFMKPGLC